MWVTRNYCIFFSEMPIKPFAYLKLGLSVFLSCKASTYYEQDLYQNYDLQLSSPSLWVTFSFS